MLMEFDRSFYLIASKRIVTPQGVISGAVEIKDGKIASIVKEEETHGKIKLENVMDYGEAVVMPGLIDVHAHLDDPGRAEWEGFPSGTKAAAAGGITTLVDMPLNSEPSTVSRETLELKIKGFWGGLVPENAFNASALEDLLDAGVLGLKSFMCPSGINDFPMTNASHIKEGLSVLAKYRRPLLVHAEKAQELESDLGVEGGSNDPRCYLTYLKTRPPSWEEAAIRDLLTLTKDTRIGGSGEGAHLHIVHLSDARSSLDLIKEAKSGGDSLTIETCPHYLAFSAEEIRDGDTRFKCSPPIRNAANKEKLWEALLKSQWLERKSSVVGVLSRGRFKRTKTEKPKEPRVPKVKKLTGAERARLEKENVRASRKEKFLAMAKKAVERYQRDPDYQFLHERVSDLFAECLKSDIEHLNSDKQPKKISLAAKWCPSIDSSFDRATLICECIAKKVFPRESCFEYQELEEEHYAYRVRDRLRKEVLVPLRKALELPEVYMSATQWGLIPYNRVASVAMKLYKDKFLKHDHERFGKYLADVKAGKSTIAAGALLPHEIIASLNIDSYMVYRYMDSDDEDRVQDDGGCQVAELQWKRMVDDLLKQGKLRNSLAVCDVSGSMNGDPMDVSVALGLLLSELSADPWKGKVITFSASPKLHLIEGDDLRAKCAFMRDMDWGDNTNFQKVFDLLLEVAVKGNLKPEDMIKRVFVFSDMEFDESSASGNNWETDYEAIKRKFEERGYGNAVPQIVFWNLRHSEATPASSNQPGVAFLSGFSKNLIKMFMDNDGEIRPDRIMEAAISGEEYQRLVLVD